MKIEIVGSRMAIPSVCPECENPVDVVSIPPNKNDSQGWQTAIECDTCDDRMFVRELDE
ncbi:hypothetical protein DM2_671 [Halorubrum sp. DM2]|uniref:hypothetical protein n=1 Tax=Halorubrum sp. DM2 TaxID=2527867 RepID=UPI0024B84FBD|nr:hypothetical protein [Halorubrum sp. DM2]VTT87337.1 hypothetical protein DM2_671 [Halorubrum sp. DM2]